MGDETHIKDRNLMSYAIAVRISVCGFISVRARHLGILAGFPGWRRRWRVDS